MRPLSHLIICCLLSLGFLLSGCARVYHLADEQVKTYRITEKTSDSSKDSKIEKMIDPYRRELSAEMGEKIGVASSTLEKGDTESSLGNFVADAVLTEAERLTRKDFDFAICNSGGIRIPSLPAGPITRGHIYELMPFDNYLVTMEVPGTIILKLFDRMAEAGGWPISHGVTYQIKAKKAQNILIGDLPVDPAKTYSFVLSDYLAEGGGELFFLKDIPYQNLGVYYRDAMIDYVILQQEASKSIDAILEGRVVNLDL